MLKSSFVKLQLVQYMKIVTALQSFSIQYLCDGSYQCSSRKPHSRPNKTPKLAGLGFLNRVFNPDCSVGSAIFWLNNVEKIRKFAVSCFSGGSGFGINVSEENISMFVVKLLLL